MVHLILVYKTKYIQFTGLPANHKAYVFAPSLKIFKYTRDGLEFLSWHQ